MTIIGALLRAPPDTTIVTLAVLNWSIRILPMIVIVLKLFIKGMGLMPGMDGKIIVRGKIRVVILVGVVCKKWWDIFQV